MSKAFSLKSCDMEERKIAVRLELTIRARVEREFTHARQSVSISLGKASGTIISVVYI